MGSVYLNNNNVAECLLKNGYVYHREGWNDETDRKYSMLEDKAK